MLINEVSENLDIRTVPLTTDRNLPLSTYIEDMNNGEIRLDHPLQRYALQWDKARKGNFVRRVIQGGEFLPLLICTQFDENGCEIEWLIDGKQRLTTLKEFVEGAFAIHPKTIDYLVTYDGILYARKSMRNGRFGLKKNRSGELIPVLDENGNRQRIRQTIDIRGLKFGDLPPELQTKVKKYMIPAQIKHNCTDDDIKLEIIDYNSGSPMNAAQIGNSTLGGAMATVIKELSEHRFVLDKCGFTENNRIKGVTERSVGEALGLVSFGTDGWIKEYKGLCSKMADCITNDHIEWFENLLDKLDEATIASEEIEKHMVNKEFFITIANFDYFLGKNYKLECYGDFLQAFVSDIKYRKVIKTGELDDDGNEILDSYVSVYEKSTKNKSVVESRLSQMNEMLDDYLTENCDGMIEDECEDSDADVSDGCEFSLGDVPEELQDFAQKFANDELAVQSLILTTNSPYNNFEPQTLRNQVEWYRASGNKQMLDDCLFYKSFVTDNGVGEDDKNLPHYIYAVKYACDGTDDVNVDDWLTEFIKHGFHAIDSDRNNTPTSNSTIMLKQSEVIKSIREYQNRKEDNDEII